MRLCILFAVFAFALPSITSATSFEVRFQANKIHGLFVWAQTIAGDPHRSESLRQHFIESKYNTPEVQQQIEEFNEVRQYLSRSYNFPGYPRSRHVSQDLEKLFMIRAGSSQSIDDFSARTIGLIPPGPHDDLMSSLQSLLPIYEELVWKPSLPKLQQSLHALEALSHDANMATMLTKAAQFYRADWPTQVPFIVNLYPIPGKNHGSGENLGHFQSVGILLEREDIVGTFGVIIHELCHALYEAQPPSVQHEFEKAFVQHHSSSNLQAYHYINEGLATAIGNGWAYERAGGKIDEQGWYNNPYIETYARALFPIVKNFLEHDLPWTNDFVSKAIEIFERELPKAHLEFANILNHINLYWNPPLDGQELRSQLRKHFRIQSISGHTPLNGSSSLSTLQEGIQTHLVVIADEVELSWLPEAYQGFREVIAMGLKENKSFIFAAKKQRAAALIILRIGDSGLEPLLEHMQNIKMINTSDPFLPFNYKQQNRGDNL